jgi:molybdate transport system regulatory protein
MSRAAIRFRIDFGPQLAVGPGKIALLESIRRSGSLSQAARELKMSYRRAWLLLDSLNGAFAQPVVLTNTGGRRGGGSQLTDLGEELIRTYRAFEAAAQRRATRDFMGLAGQVRAARPRRTLSSAAPLRRLSGRAR